MRRKVFIGLLTIFVWTTGIFFGTTSFPPKIVHSAKEIKVTEMQRKHENIKLAKTYAQVGFGWKNEQTRCLMTLWSAESRFDDTAQNPNSTAFGIAQLLGEQSRDPRLQILRGLRYIEGRYGQPCQALFFFKRHFWY